MHSIGRIGLNLHTQKLLPKILRMFEDPSSSVRAMAVWVIGKFGALPETEETSPIPSTKILESVQGLLEDKYWKVRTAACISLACLGPEAILVTLPSLLNYLKSGHINRQIVSETIIKMGQDGERILVEILKRMRVKNCGLVVPIIRSLELVGIWSGNGSIDFVLEELINGVKGYHYDGVEAKRKKKKGGSAKIRGACLESLIKVVKRIKSGLQEMGIANEGEKGIEVVSSYLGFQSLMDVFLEGLKDPLPTNRNVSPKSLTN